MKCIIAILKKKRQYVYIYFNCTEKNYSDIKKLSVSTVVTCQTYRRTNILLFFKILIKLLDYDRH